MKFNRFNSSKKIKGLNDKDVFVTSSKKKSKKKREMAEEKKSDEVPKKVKVLLVVTNHTKLGDTKKQTGFYLPEVAHPYYLFKEKSYDVVFTSIKGGLAEVDEGSIKNFSSDATCQKFVKEFLESNQGKYLETYAISALDAIFYSGGHGTMWDFPNDSILNKAAEKIYNNGGVIGAVCHGPAGILNLKDEKGEYLIKGKNVTGFSNKEEEAVELTKVVPFSLEDELKKRKANYSSADNFKSHVVTDTRLVTGQNPASSSTCAEAVIDQVSKAFFG
ncbi:ThiJ/PfpI domain protein [Reticulomyxa filosa]|uniref:ThiJ/PfpI domain protein n=1 Tax=Reticulomyxa filosa TaxID=46433 RepID=X6LZC2_RETFI|nr:ThiJ/PfpI domain protein [Reticulomyxa filosa]|eukprot:ETO06949.1 ThiJ/PfpI domain protein [Reticulomyxa filosa]